MLRAMVSPFARKRPARLSYGVELGVPFDEVARAHELFGAAKSVRMGFGLSSARARGGRSLRAGVLPAVPGRIARRFGKSGHGLE
jgi:hypothetical protein